MNLKPTIAGDNVILHFNIGKKRTSASIDKVLAGLLATRMNVRWSESRDRLEDWAESKVRDAIRDGMVDPQKDSISRFLMHMAITQIADGDLLYEYLERDYD
jgi:hypothetical protein